MKVSAADDFPLLLLSLCANARPTVFLISQKVSSALNISNDICTLGFNGNCTCSDCLFDVDDTLNFQLLGALGNHPRVHCYWGLHWENLRGGC